MAINQCIKIPSEYKIEKLLLTACLTETEQTEFFIQPVFQGVD